MSTKARNKDSRRPVGRKPTAGTRSGAKRVPGPSVTRPTAVGTPGEQAYAKPGEPQPPASDPLGEAEADADEDTGLR